MNAEDRQSLKNIASKMMYAHTTGLPVVTPLVEWAETLKAIADREPQRIISDGPRPGIDLIERTPDGCEIARVKQQADGLEMTFRWADGERASDIYPIANQ